MTAEERLIAAALATDLAKARRLLADRIAEREQRAAAGTNDNERN